MTTQHGPLWDERRSALRDIQFEAEDVHADGLRAYVAALRATFGNGSVEHQRFRIPRADRVRHLLDGFNPLETGFVQHLCSSEAVARVLPIGELRQNLWSREVFQWIHPLELAGRLAVSLAQGGAYLIDVPSAELAKTLAEDAASDLLSGGMDQYLVLASDVAWSSYFCDVAWDRTWIIIDRTGAHIDVLIATDTD